MIDLDELEQRAAYGDHVDIFALIRELRAAREVVAKARAGLSLCVGDGMIVSPTAYARILELGLRETECALAAYDEACK